MEEIQEVWKDIPNYEGYQVSNKGSIRSFKRSAYTNLAPKVLKLIINDRYIYVGAQINKKRRKLSVHRAVAMAFIANPFNKPFVNHINGIKHDNRVENLEWVTHLENMAHAVNAGLIKFRGEKQNFSKLTTEQVLKIRQLSSQGMSCSKIVKEMAIVANRTIRDVLLRKTWKHI